MCFYKQHIYVQSSYTQFNARNGIVHTNFKLSVAKFINVIVKWYSFYQMQ